MNTFLSTPVQFSHQLIFQCNSLEIVKDKGPLKVNISVPNNTRLFVGNIPKLLTRADIIQEVEQHACKFLETFSLA